MADSIKVDIPTLRGTQFHTIGQLIEPVAPYFFAVVAEIEERCRRDHRERGEGGTYVRSLEEWAVFCDAAEDETQGHLDLYGYALVRTVRRVRELIAAGFTARELHTARYWDERTDDSQEQARAAFSREVEARSRERDRQHAVEKEKEIALIREEGRMLAKREAAQKWGGPRDKNQRKLLPDPIEETTS